MIAMCAPERCGRQTTFSAGVSRDDDDAALPALDGRSTRAAQTVADLEVSDIGPPTKAIRLCPISSRWEAAR